MSATQHRLLRGGAGGAGGGVGVVPTASGVEWTSGTRCQRDSEVLALDDAQMAASSGAVGTYSTGCSGSWTPCRAEPSGLDRRSLSGLAGRVDGRGCFVPRSWARPPRELQRGLGRLSRHPDLATCPRAVGSLPTPLPCYFSAPRFSETLSSFSMELRHQINFLIPSHVPQTSNLRHWNVLTVLKLYTPLARSRGRASSTPYRVTKQDMRSHCSQGHRPSTPIPARGQTQASKLRRGAPRRAEWPSAARLLAEGGTIQRRTRVSLHPPNTALRGVVSPLPAVSHGSWACGRQVLCRLHWAPLHSLPVAVRGPKPLSPL